MKSLKLAVKWEVKVEGAKRSIQLLDASGNKLKGGESRWEGDFSCHSNQLTTLEGAPKEVGGDFSCHSNQLTNLEGAPKEVGGGFYCDGNQLTNLEGAPKEVGGDFYCDGNQLTTLEGAPKEVGGDFSCYSNQLTNLEGAPKEVGGYFYCDNNQLTSLEGAPKTHVQSMLSVQIRLRISLRIHASCLKRKKVFADGMLSKLVSRKKYRSLEVFKVQAIGKKEFSFVIRRGDVFSHGKTIKEAKESLKYKISNRDVSEFKKWKVTDTKSATDLIHAYRAITGACEFGVRDFYESHKIPKKMTVKKAIELTHGKYGNDQFKAFFEDNG